MSALGMLVSLAQLQSISGLLHILKAEMVWSKDNIIAILALFATCAPIFILLVTMLVRRRKMQHARKNGRVEVGVHTQGANSNGSHRTGATSSLAKPTVLSSAWPLRAQGICACRSRDCTRGYIFRRAVSLRCECGLS